jgi:hypothetical protein
MASRVIADFTEVLPSGDRRFAYNPITRCATESSSEDFLQVSRRCIRRLQDTLASAGYISRVQTSRIGLSRQGFLSFLPINHPRYCSGAEHYTDPWEYRFEVSASRRWVPGNGGLLVPAPEVGRVYPARAAVSKSLADSAGFPVNSAT